MRLGAALVLARRSVELGKDSLLLAYFQMALGMVEYRSGNYAAADEALLAGSQGGKDNFHIAGTSAFYRALSLFRQGKEDDARKLATEASARMRPLPGDEKNPLVGNADAEYLILLIFYKQANDILRLGAAPIPKP